jgi:hypothetical protein
VWNTWQFDSVSGAETGLYWKFCVKVSVLLLLCSTVSTWCGQIVLASSSVPFKVLSFKFHTLGPVITPPFRAYCKVLVCNSANMSHNSVCTMMVSPSCFLFNNNFSCDLKKRKSHGAKSVKQGVVEQQSHRKSGLSRCIVLMEKPLTSVPFFRWFSPHTFPQTL